MYNRKRFAKPTRPYSVLKTLPLGGIQVEIPMVEQMMTALTMSSTTPRVSSAYHRDFLQAIEQKPPAPFTHSVQNILDTLQKKVHQHQLHRTAYFESIEQRTQENVVRQEEWLKTLKRKIKMDATRHEEHVPFLPLKYVKTNKKKHSTRQEQDLKRPTRESSTVEKASFFNMQNK